jgi:hypothetical protein
LATARTPPAGLTIRAREPSDGPALAALMQLPGNLGGNLSSAVRRVVYFRLRSQTHAQRWRDCVQDALLEFAPVRAAVASLAREG